MKPKAAAFDCEHRQDADADNVVLGATSARELGVLLVPDQSQVSGNQTPA